MELRVLRYFLAVVREESITAAAQSLHLTQPTLSRQLMELEEELGARLLIRGGRNQKIVLTEKGMLLRRRAEELLELADRTQLELGEDEGELRGEITIGGGESDAMRIIARAAYELKRQHPGISYSLFSGNAEDVKERLDKGLLDFGVFVEPTDLQKYESLRLPAADAWGLLLRRDHPLAAKAAVTADDLKSLPLLASRQRLAQENLSAWLGLPPESLNIVATYNLIYNAALMVEEGLGCALCLDKLVRTCGSPLCFLPLSPRVEAQLSIAWKKYHTPCPAAAAFLEKVRELTQAKMQQKS